MKNSSLFGVVLRVENIETERAFYRDVVGLGQPEMDSNFWVEFRVTSNSALCLEKVLWINDSAKCDPRTSWILNVERLDHFLERMAKYGYSPEQTDSEKFGFATVTFKDPEGNIFYVTEGHELL